jgi:D-lactate dehydrogenase (cytochrome)
MKSIIGKDRIENELPDILHDESRYTCGIPQAVFFPKTIEDLQNVIHQASKENIPLTFIGARTGTTGGSVPVENCYAVCFSDMNRILEVTWKSNGKPVLLCEPGVTLSSITEFLLKPEAFPYKVKNRESLQAGKWFYAPDPTETTAQVGGTAATNASGARSFRFGPTREHIFSAQIVLASGETLDTCRGSHIVSGTEYAFITNSGKKIVFPVPSYRSPAIKNASGYYSREKMDLLDLFIGSEGTLGAFAGLGFTLSPACQFVSGLSFFPSRECAFDFADFLRTQPQVASIEFFDSSSLDFLHSAKRSFQIDIPEFPKYPACAIMWEYIEKDNSLFEAVLEIFEAQLKKNGSSLDNTWSGFEQHEMERLKAFRHALPEAINSTIALNRQCCNEIRKLGSDTALNAKVFRKVYNEYLSLIESSGLTYAAFGHLGDYHMHINLIPDSKESLERSLKIYDEMMNLTILNGGTISAEHGVGKLKQKYLKLMYEPGALNQMVAVKNALDPQKLLNPYNLFALQSDEDQTEDCFLMHRF